MEAVEGILIRRRVKDIVARNLPPKLDITLVCRPEEEQRLLYDKVIEENREQPLVCVGLLTKVNNSPRLLSGSYSIGSKMKLLLSLVKSIVSHCPSERIVIVSHYTQTLDLIAIELDAIGLKFSRMDGSTCLQKRTEMIRRLNADYETDCNILLMSAKTGGVGTNLVGASRLIMFDISWNPVHDLQTSARLYRPGQKASCVYVYRLISAGMADEWIWQRQEQKIKISSITLEDTAADEEEDNDSNIEEFEVKMLDGCVDTSCLNHALSECHCDAKPPPELEYDQTFHIDTSINSDWLSLIVDKTLDSTVITNVTFAYVHKHSPK